MEENFDDVAAENALMREQIILLEPILDEFAGKTNRMRIFNAAAIGVPLLTTMIPFVTSLNANGAVLISAGTAAVLTQTSRWWKGKLRDEFETIWNAAHEQTRSSLLGHLRGTFDKNTGQTRNVVGKEDFDLKNPIVRSSLPFVAICVILNTPIAPALFFMGAQVREWADGVKLNKVTQFTQAYFNNINAGAPKI